MGYSKDWKGKGGGKWGSSSSAPPSDALGGSFVPRPGLRGPSGELEPKRPRLSAPPPPPAPGGQHPQSHEGRSKGGWHGQGGGSCDGTQGKSRPPSPRGLPGGGGKGGDMGSLPMPAGGPFPPPPAASNNSCSCGSTSPGSPSSCLPLSAAMSKVPPGMPPPSFQAQSGSTGCSLPMPLPPGASNEPGSVQPLARPPMQQLQTGPGAGPPPPTPGLPSPVPFSGPSGMSSSPAPLPGPVPLTGPSGGPPGVSAPPAPAPGPVPATALRGPAPPGLAGTGPPLPMPGLPGPAPLTGPSGLRPPPAGLSAGGLLTAPTGPLGATFPPLPGMPATPFGPAPLTATGGPTTSMRPYSFSFDGPTLPGLLPTAEVKVPVSLARATASVVPMKQAPSGTAAAAANAAAPSNKQIAMQFLSADREKQTEMLRDPKVAMAILQTLGESASKTQPAAGAAPVPGPPPPGQPPPSAAAMVPGLAAAAPPAPATLPAAGLAAPPAPATVPPAPAAPAPATADASAPGPSKMAWMGKMTLARSMRKQLQTQATLLYGKVELVELALRSAAGSSGVLNISHRVPYDDVARRTPGAVLQFIPATVNEQIQYGEYIQYFRSKVRAGVAPLDKVEALYLIPPAEETAGLLSSLAAVGVPALPKNCLLGVIADAPGPSVTMHTEKPAAITNAPSAAAQAEAGRTSDKAAGNNAGAATGAAAEGAKAKAEEAAKPAAETNADQAARGPDADKGAQAAAGGEDGGEGMEDADGQGQEEFSREALLNLFSNPELLKSLQGAVEEGGSAAAD